MREPAGAHLAVDPVSPHAQVFRHVFGLEQTRRLAGVDAGAPPEPLAVVNSSAMAYLTHGGASRKWGQRWFGGWGTTSLPRFWLRTSAT